MPSYYRKNSGEILKEALEKLQNHTPITSISPGSVMRAFAEVITTEIGDLYDIMDYNLQQNLISTATGTALDMLGSLFNVQRKTVNTLAAIDKQIGAFYFYIKNSVIVDIKIPAGTRVFTDASSFVGRRFTYTTETDAVIIAGRTKAYTSLKPTFTDAVFTSGANTLVLHDFQSPTVATVFCTNPKEIAQQLGYETDDAYRVRIIKQAKVLAGGTPEALRFAGLSVSGIRDVRLREAPYGMGSFEVILVPEQNGDTKQAISNATAAMQAARPIGVRMYARTPSTVVGDIKVQLVMPGAGITSISDQTTKRAETGIMRYINSLLPGDPIIFNKLLSIIIDSSDIVKDVIIQSFAINGQEVLRRNYQPGVEEQIIPGTITATVATSI